MYVRTYILFMLMYVRTYILCMLMYVHMYVYVAVCTHVHTVYICMDVLIELKLCWVRLSSLTSFSAYCFALCPRGVVHFLGHLHEIDTAQQVHPSTVDS